MKKSRGSRPSSELFTITFRNAEDVIEFDERWKYRRMMKDNRSTQNGGYWVDTFAR